MTESLLTTYDSLLFDLDGTVWEGGRLLPHAQKYLTTASIPVMYITNNASRGPEVVAEILTKLGVPTDERHVVTSAQAAVEFAQQRLQPGDPVYVLGSESFKNLARHGGLRVVDSADDNPKAVLHGHNPETGWAELSEAALSIRNGAYYFASNLDTTLPMERGLMVGNGSMVAAVTTATGVTPLSAGKPEPAMFHSAAAKVQSTRPLAVGDRLNTDIAGGVAANMDTFHVLTGVSRHWALVHAPPISRKTCGDSTCRQPNSPHTHKPDSLPGAPTITRLCSPAAMLPVGVLWRRCVPCWLLPGLILPQGLPVRLYLRMLGRSERWRGGSSCGAGAGD